MKLPDHYLAHRPLMSYLFERTLYDPEYMKRYFIRGWSSDESCYRTIEELMIEQLRYFMIEKEGGWRERILRDLRIHREMNKIKTMIQVT
jgi:hypothetical protein